VPDTLGSLSARAALTASRTDLTTMSGDTVWAAKSHFLDSLGMMLAGAADPRSRIVGDPHAASSDSRAPSELALRLSIMCGVLGLDDFDEFTRAHPGAVIVPALIAAVSDPSIGRSTHVVSGEDLLAGMVVGYQLMGGLGAAMGAPHLHALGYHPSSILGAPGAALAVGRLHGLPLDLLAHCVGIGASVACGINEFDPVDQMRGFQTAWAARSGLESARFAVAGLKSSSTALEAPRGLIRRTAPHFAGDGDLMAGAPKIESVSFKPYPHFSDLHPATSALHRIVDDTNFDVDDMERLIVRVPIEIAPGLHRSYPPTTSREAKRSAELCMATVLASAAGGKSVGHVAKALSQMRLDDEHVLALGERVTVLTDLPPGTGVTAIVELQLRDGTKALAEATGYPGDGRQADLRWGWSDVRERFVDTARPLIGSASTASIEEFVAGLDELPDVSTGMNQVIAMVSR
jgi:2-methylcitrate dehydratase PrpD